MLLDRAEGQSATPLWLVAESALPQWLSKLDPAAASWLSRHGFQAERARVMTVPGPAGSVAAAVAGLGAQAETAPPSLWDGAACALGLTRLLLAMDAPVQLRLIIPAVENSLGGAAYRPGDVWSSRKGLTVEIGNTDAEGRLVLADALADADAERPELLIDLATLTGAARTALGPDLPAVFSGQPALAEAARVAGEAVCDPLWPMPLWAGYDEELASRVADLNNVSSGSFAGAIIAALFLKRFVTATPEWLHVDLYAWNPKDRPGRPQGAEAQGLRALYALILKKFG